MRQFHQAPLSDEWAYLSLGGVSLRVRRPSGRQRVQRLVAYGVRGDGTRQLLAFLQTRGESRADWEALLQDLYRRGRTGKNLLLIVTDGCRGLAAASQTVYPQVLLQRCWVHKMRNILEKVRKADYDVVKTDAQAIYLAEGRSAAQVAARAFCRRWRSVYRHGAAAGAGSTGVVGLLPFSSPSLEETTYNQHYRALFRRATPLHPAMVCFVNVQSVERIIYSMKNRSGQLQLDGGIVPSQATLGRRSIKC